VKKINTTNNGSQKKYYKKNYEKNWVLKTKYAKFNNWYLLILEPSFKFGCP